MDPQDEYCECGAQPGEPCDWGDTPEPHPDFHPSREAAAEAADSQE